MRDRDFEQYRDDIEKAERRVAGEIDPGARAVVVAVLVLLLACALALPHAGGAKGFDVMQGDSVAIAESITVPSRIFVWFTAVFGVFFSMLALVTRRWTLAWIAVAGTAIASVFGVLSIWTRQTPGLGGRGDGPGVGLVLGVVVCIALTFHWLRVVWSRTVLYPPEQRSREEPSGEK